MSNGENQTRWLYIGYLALTIGGCAYIAILAISTLKSIARYRGELPAATAPADR